MTDNPGDDMRTWIGQAFAGRAALGLFLIPRAERTARPSEIVGARNRYKAGGGREAHLSKTLGEVGTQDCDLGWVPPEGCIVVQARSEESFAWVQHLLGKPALMVPNGGHWLICSPFKDLEAASGEVVVSIPCPPDFIRPVDRTKDPYTISTCVGAKGHIVFEMSATGPCGGHQIVHPFDLDALATCPEEMAELLRKISAKQPNQGPDISDEDADEGEPIVDDEDTGPRGDGIGRSTPGDPCYVCGGNQQGSRGTPEHCGGFRGGDYVYCTKVEFGDRRGDSGAYRHHLRDCECGHTHDRIPDKPKASRKSYDSHEEMIAQWASRGIQQNGTVYQLKCIYPYSPRTGGDPKLIVARFESDAGDKTFRQGSADGRGRWSARKDKSVPPMLYRWRELADAVSRGERTVYIVEGEKDVENMTGAGAVATCAPGGAGGGVATIAALATEFRGLRVKIVADKDPAGYSFAAKVVQLLMPVAAEIEVLEAKIGNDASDALAEYQLGDAFERLTLDDLAARAGMDPDELQLVQVVLSQDELRNQMTLVGALKRRSEREFEPLVRAGQVVRIRDGSAVFLDYAHTRNLVLDVAQARRVDPRGNVVPANFSREFISAAVARAGEHFFELKGITAAPALQPDGRILDKPGFDPATGIYYAPPDGFEMEPLPEVVTEADFRGAVAAYNFVFGDFVFATGIDKANGFAALLTTVARSAVDGLVPGFLIDAPTAGSGKTKFAESVMIIAQGRVTTGAAKSDKAEMAKSLETMLGEGRQILLLDNIQADSVLDSSVLAAIMTAPHDYTFRILGKSKSSKAPMRSVVLATGNNVTVSRELARRFLRVRIDTGLHDPASRPASEFNVPDLTNYLGANRAAMVRAALVILRWTMVQLESGWIPSCETRGDMHGFWRLIGGAVELSGWGAVGMAEAMDDIAFDDSENEADFGDFLEAAAQKIEGKSVTLRELAEATNALPYRDQVLMDAESGKYRPWHQVLSYLARTHRDKPHRARSGKTWALVRGQKSHGVTPWQVKETRR